MIGSKTYYIRKLDALISKEVRSMGFCERCKTKGGFLQPAHIISRNNRTLRWDKQNILCFCSVCHFWSHQDPLGFTEWIKDYNPDRFLYLMMNKDKITKRSAKDLKELYGNLSK